MALLFTFALFWIICFGKSPNLHPPPCLSNYTIILFENIFQRSISASIIGSLKEGYQACKLGHIIYDQAYN